MTSNPRKVREYPARTVSLRFANLAMRMFCSGNVRTCDHLIVLILSEEEDNKMVAGCCLGIYRERQPGAVPTIGLLVITDSMLSGIVTGDHHSFGLAVSGTSGLCDNALVATTLDVSLNSLRHRIYVCMQVAFRSNKKVVVD